MPRSNNALEEHSFLDRLSISDAVDQMLVQYLVDIGHLTSFHKATKDEDMNKAIDYFFSGDGMDDDPIQWKVRVKPRQIDVPVCRSQPFRGYDSEHTKDGRDYKGLMLVGETTRYCVAIKDKYDKFCEVYALRTSIIRPLVQQLEQEWAAVDKFSPGFYAKASMTAAQNNRMMQGKPVHMLYRSETGTGEVWWKKNSQDKSPKINFYFPSSLKERSVIIPDEIGFAIKAVYDRMSEEARNRQ